MLGRREGEIQGPWGGGKERSKDVGKERRGDPRMLGRSKGRPKAAGEERVYLRTLGRNGV